ncbi:DUF3348 domain-containing protein [Trinickia diaoshuihuensis]|jgi:hypothetical protein|uniref:DUF3348 domain-containing protein n=1 Tax=Trinickia diaoshuihuensis TaxID=2292265 RepID=UPI000E261758|nr:DUF3348 domain-containing protein [Trinickia diaoshuihuensis]
MVHAPGRGLLKGPALIRLLARLTDAGFPESEQPLADRLGQWLGWTDAIALSSALGAKPPCAPAQGPTADRAEDALCMRVRTSLTDAINRDATLAPQRAGGRARHRRDPAPADIAPEYAAFRQAYLALQERMDSAIGNLRTVLRGMLASRTPELSRLASVDAVMERVLGVREHNALAAVPGLLAAHFERLRDAELAASESGNGSAEVADAESPLKDGPWLDAFRQDMRSVLIAELEIRFQPVEGLRSALRAC